jgi:hypothetical protein
VCDLSTVVIFRHPSILRNLICPLAKAEEQGDGPSSLGSELLRLRTPSEFFVEPLARVPRVYDRFRAGSLLDRGDELHDSASLSDEVWEARAVAFGVEQIFELIALVGTD